MKLKATLYLIEVLAGVATLALSVFTILLNFIPQIGSESTFFLVLSANFLTGIILFDLLLFIFWVARRSLWAIFPFVAIAFSYNYITAIVQLHFNRQESYDVKVATYNVHSFSVGAFTNTLEQVASGMRRNEVDILTFQEFALTETNDLENVRHKFDFLPYYYVPKHKSGGQPIAIFSRYKITKAGSVNYEGTNNSFIWVDVDVDGRTVRVVSAHLQTTRFSESGDELAVLKSSNVLTDDSQRSVSILKRRYFDNVAMRQRQVDDVMSYLQCNSCSTILCGDFNDTPSSLTYSRVSHVLDDGFLTGGLGYIYTYRGFGGMMRIDYIFNSNDMECRNYYAENWPTSDHKPVFAELKFR